MTDARPADPPPAHAGGLPAADGAGAAVGWRLERRPDGSLAFMTAAGAVHSDVELRRAFPLSAPQAGLAILAADGSELVWIDSLADVEGPLRQLLEEELARREFVPVIERIERVSEGRPAEWVVVTDRGPHRFTVGHPDDVSWQPDGGVNVTDADGIRYRIPAAVALDPRSRRLLDRAV